MLRSKRKSSENARAKITKVISPPKRSRNNSDNDIYNLDSEHHSIIDNSDDDNNDEFIPEKTEVHTQNIRLQKKLRNMQKKRESVCNVVSWTPNQRKHFAQAFKYVYEDVWMSSDTPSDEIIHKIAQRVNGRSFEEVKKYFLHYQKITVASVRKENLPIDVWLEACTALTPPGNMLEQQLGFAISIAAEEPIEISPEEEYQQTSSSKQTPNYKLLYRYITCAVANKPLPHLPPLESLVVEECMQSLIQKVLGLGNEDLSTSLKRIYLHVAKDPKQEQELDYEEVENNLLHNISLFNPLGINPDSIITSPPENDK